MIDQATRAGFADEMQKIAFWATKMQHAVGAGWHGLDSKGVPVEGAGWLRGGKGWNRNLPIGGKTFTVLSTGSMIPGALSAQDPTGRNRSRAERIAGLAGNTVGGLIGSGAFVRTIGSKHPIMSGIAGSMLGGNMGERIATLPFATKRLLLGKRNPAAPLRGMPGRETVNEGWKNTAPGGLNTTPDAVVGQAQAI